MVDPPCEVRRVDPGQLFLDGGDCFLAEDSRAFQALPRGGRRIVYPDPSALLVALVLVADGFAGHGEVVEFRVDQWP